MLAIKFLSRYEEFNCEQIVTFDTNAEEYENICTIFCDISKKVVDLHQFTFELSV